MIIYLKNMAGYKIEHFRGMTYDKVRPIFEREYKKVQTLFNPDKDVEEPKKKRVTDETLLQETEVSGSESTQEVPSNDPKEISEEDVQNMLEIVPLSEYKVEALQVKYPIIDWKIHTEGSRTYWKIIRVGGITKAYQSFEDMLKGFDREDLVALWNLVKEKVHHVSSTRGHDIFMLTEKDYPLSNGVMILMLSAKLQVKEDNEMARDLMMKIFMEANKPNSRSLDTSSKKAIEIEEISKKNETDSVYDGRDSKVMEDICDVNCKDQLENNDDECQKADNRILVHALIALQTKNSKDEKFFSYVNVALAKNNDVNRSIFERPIEVDDEGNKLCNVPLEAWTTSGISALASRLGKPLVMDTVTVEIGKKGVGRVKYASILVEVPANKCVPEEIEVVYRDKDRVEICRKKITIKFDWIPLRCPNCCVFGHDLSSCGKINQGKDETGGRKQKNRPGVQNQKPVQKQGGHMQKEKPVNRFTFQTKNVEMKDDFQSPSRDVTKEDCKGASTSSPIVLEDLEIDKQEEGNKGINPIDVDTGEINDVFRDENGIAQGMENDVIMGIDK
nr:hypothetical protein [Tanacetum cinerariifolium]